MADLATTFRRPFPEQIAAFRLRTRNLVPTATWRDLWKGQHDRAFVVAGAMKADLLADLAQAVDKATSDGTSLDEFRRDFRATVERRGWHGWTGEGTTRGEAWRTRVIYRTNMRTSYMAGRHAQLVEGGFRFWVYFHGGSVEPRLDHLSWNGIALPPDHPFWAKHFPPNGWGCSCYVSGARSERGVRRLGGDPTKTLPDGWDAIDTRTGEPKGVGTGWGYAPGRSVAEEVTEALRRKRASLPEGLGRALEAESRIIQDDGSGLHNLLKDVAGRDYADLIMEEAREVDEPRLGITQKMAIRVYTGLQHRQINAALWENASGGQPDERYMQLVAAMDQGLARVPKFQGRAYRGMAELPDDVLERYLSLEPGDALQLAGYTSTSSARNKAFEGEVQLIFQSRTGRRIAHMSGAPEEEEVLFPRGSLFRVRERTFENGRLTLILDEIGIADAPRRTWHVLSASNRANEEPAPRRRVPDPNA